MKVLLTTKEVLKLYNSNPNLIGGFGEDFGRRLSALDRYEDNTKLAAYQYCF